MELESRASISARVEAFSFVPGPLRRGPQVTLEYAQSKREQWAVIMDLSIDIRDWKGSSQLGLLPPPLDRKKEQVSSSTVFPSSTRTIFEPFALFFDA